jgi:hypothetical protein
MPARSAGVEYAEAKSPSIGGLGFVCCSMRSVCVEEVINTWACVSRQYFRGGRANGIEFGDHLHGCSFITGTIDRPVADKDTTY